MLPINYSNAVIFDIESDGLLEELTCIHTIVLKKFGGEVISSCSQEGYLPLVDALLIIQEAPIIVGHNIQAFDIPAIQKVYPWFKPKGIIRDTLIMSRLMFPEQERHSLEFWGTKLGNPKMEYTLGWARWNPTMQKYCEQDVLVNEDILREELAEEYPEDSIQLEHDFANLLDWQMHMGVDFDEEGACILAQELEALDSQYVKDIKAVIPDWVNHETFIPKRPNKTKGWQKGVPIVRTKVVPFNPGSRTQIVRYFTEKYGWEPIEFTEKNNPKVSGKILNELPYPEAKPLATYLENKKLLSQILTGDGAWLKKMKGGKIYGWINHNGAVTGRCTHSDPNLGQVPSSRGYKGHECRSLFRAPTGFKIVGVDAKGLELRNLAHFLAPYDGGRYTEAVTEGDIHTTNQSDAELPTRDNAKTFIYAFNYGAGDLKLGFIVAPEASKAEQRIRGAQIRRTFLSKNQALGTLIQIVKDTARARGFLYGLDRRKLFVRSPHQALNTLLQGAGAVVMKKAMVILWKGIIGESLDWREYLRGEVKAYPILHVHDEMQSCVIESYAEEFRQKAEDSIRLAGEYFNYQCPLAGDAKIGDTWAETH